MSDSPTHGHSQRAGKESWQGKCHHCGEPTEEGCNYCPGDCIVKAWRASGAKEHLPNGLPVRCLNANPPLLLEVEHGDHQDYLFPVVVDYSGEPEIIDGFELPHGETHALIYTDGNVAMTLYECCYHLWLLPRDGVELPMLDHGGAWRKGKYRLAPESLAKVKEWAQAHGKLERP